MMFASKTPRTLNHDPRPWRPLTLQERYERQYDIGLHFDPRPEFDHIQHNDPNPILVVFRSDAKHFEITWTPDRIAEWVAEETRIDLGAPDDYTDEQRDHARKVLTRLAAMAEAVIA